MTRLPCDNLHDFINGLKHFYSVTTGEYVKGQTVWLYNDAIQSPFEIMHIYRFEEHSVLGLVSLNKEIVNNFR